MLCVVSALAMLLAFGIGSPATATGTAIGPIHKPHAHDHDLHHHGIDHHRHHGHHRHHHGGFNEHIDANMFLNGGRDDAQGVFRAEGVIDDAGAAAFRYHSNGHPHHHGHPHPHHHDGDHVHGEQHLHGQNGKLLLSWFGHRHWHGDTLFIFAHWSVSDAGGAYAGVRGEGHVWYKIDFSRDRVQGHFEGRLR